MRRGRRDVARRNRYALGAQEVLGLKFVDVHLSRFEVQGSRFKVAGRLSSEFRPEKFALLQISNESGDHPAHPNCALAGFFKTLACNVILIQSSIEMIANFAAGPFCCGKELNELLVKGLAVASQRDGAGEQHEQCDRP